jgi:outer membrane receptor protein involved in Fe transport
LSLAVASALAFASAHAQQQLPKVEVIGVSPVPGLEVPRDQVPANVQTARSADLERAQAQDLSSFLNRRLGSVHINEVQNNPFQPDVNYRGFTASPLLGTQQGLSLYLDGVRMNQPFGDVVSWDLIPKSAIGSISLNPGSNPLFGLNTLGGALVVLTKDGYSHPGSSVQLLGGSNGRGSVEFEHGGNRADGLHWFVTGQKFHEQGWRVNSKSDVGQFFAKVGKRSSEGDISFTAAAAETDLNGNGLQEQRFLARDYRSVYTQPDNTRNRSVLLNLALSQSLNSAWTVAGNAYYRRIHTRTFNADLNDGSLDQATYQPNATERAALTRAGFTGFPTAGENATNTPFPKWRCIAQALLNDEPAEKCNGVLNRTTTRQSSLGLNAQLNFDGILLGMRSKALLGGTLDASRSHFVQGTELGYLNPDRSVTGVGAFGDGGRTGGNVDGAPYDTRVDLTGRTRTYSLFGSAILNVATGTHLTVSGRYNRTTVRNRDAILPGGGPGSLDGNHTFSRFNPAVGLTFTPTGGINAWVGVNQGSRAPSTVELGCADPANPCKLPNAFAGDPPLKQVVTTTVEAGVRGGQTGGLAWSLGLFRSENKDDLLFVSDNATGSGYFRNFGKTRRQGLELGLSAKPVRDLTLGANLTQLDATFQSPERVNAASNSSNSSALAGFPGVDGSIAVRPGDRIPLVPRRLLKLYADADLGKLSLGADVVAVGRSLARGNENGLHQPDGRFYLGQGYSAGYGVLNLNAAYRPTQGLKVFAQVNNLFDRKYSTAAQLGATGFNDAGNFEARPFAANANGDRPVRHSTFYAPGAPRSVNVGVKYSF